MKNTALIIIDMQKGLFEKQRKIFNESQLLNNINILIKYQKDNKLPIIFIQHNSKQLQKGTKEWEIHDGLIKSKDDIVIQKTEGDAFRNTELDDILKINKIKNIIITGLVSHGCVKATCLGGLKNNYETILLKEGHSNWNKDAEFIIEEVNFVLAQNNVNVISINELL